MRLNDIFSYFSREEVETWFKSYKLSDYLLPEQLEIVENSPIFNMDKLAKKIVDHYYMREIAFETPALFRHFTLITMEEIMEEKLPLIYSACLEYDPLTNVDFTETFHRDTSGTANSSGESSSNSNNSSSGLSILSDTPQGQINKQEILNGNYATNTSASESTSEISDTTNQTSEGSSTGKEDFTRHLKGNQGISSTYQALIKQFRENIVAIERDIIEECNQLFFLLY